MSDRRVDRIWTVFAAAWLSFLGLFISLETVLGDGQVLKSLGLVLLGVTPLVAGTAVLVLNRRRLLRPEWSAWHALGIHVLVGLLFALTTAGLATAVTALFGPLSPELVAMGRGQEFGFRAVSNSFLYVMFVGYLMWFESIRRVQESQRMAASEAVLRAEAEAKAIRAQFNPHFVFNTLHSLMLLVRADPATAERAIEDVATLILYASILQRRDVDVVPLGKELEVARRYVALEKLRLEDRLSVSWAVGPDLGELSCPAFALQTLIENAIKHGLEPRPEGGEITVCIGVEDGRLRIVVEDNGSGAHPADVRRSSGHGLDLLRRRLDARYGEAGSLEWRTAPGEGFTVTVQLPAEPIAAVQALDVIRATEESSPGPPALELVQREEPRR